MGYSELRTDVDDGRKTEMRFGCLIAVLNSYSLRLLLETSKQKTLITDYFTTNFFLILILANPSENAVTGFRVNFVFLGGSTAVFFSWSFYEESAEERKNIIILIIAEDIHLCFQVTLSSIKR